MLTIIKQTFFRKNNLPALYKIICIFSITCFFQCVPSDNTNKYYKQITEEEYQKYKTVDTLLINEKYLFTKCKHLLPITAFATLVKLSEKNKMKYFKLDYDALLENDSTIIAYSPPFKSNDLETEKNKGVWLYAEFYDNENKRGNEIYSVSDAGIRFSVDSLPANYKTSYLPTDEGIYFFKNEKLNKITSEQSEDKFYSLQTNGFYFIPNSGKLFSRFKIETIK